MKEKSKNGKTRFSYYSNSKCIVLRKWNDHLLGMNYVHGATIRLSISHSDVALEWMNMGHFKEKSLFVRKSTKKEEKSMQ